MIQRGKLEEIHCAARGAPFWIGRAKHDPLQAGMNHRAGAHRAGFLGHVERAIGEAPVAQRMLGLRDGQHLRVGRGVLEQLNLIEGTRDDPTLAPPTSSWMIMVPRPSIWPKATIPPLTVSLPVPFTESCVEAAALARVAAFSPAAPIASEATATQLIRQIRTRGVG